MIVLLTARRAYLDPQACPQPFFDAARTVSRGRSLGEDSQPGNILLCPDPIAPSGERVKLIDFGIAKIQTSSDVLTTGEQAPQTRLGSVLGTPKYMSPEQCQAQAGVDGKADIYALGVILYELLAGEAPFSASNTGTLLAMHIFKEPPPLRSIAESVSPEVAALVHAMLGKQPPERPTAGEVASALEKLEQGLQVPEPPPRGSPRPALLAVLLLVVLSLGIFALVRWRSQPSSPPPPTAERGRPAETSPAALPPPANPPSPAAGLTPDSHLPISPPPTTPVALPPPTGIAGSPPRFRSPVPGVVPHATPPAGHDAAVGAKPRPKPKRPARPVGAKIEVEIIN